MAAHVLTALKQISKQCDDNTVNFDHLEAALNLSCWTEDLDMWDYDELSQIVDRQNMSDLKQFVIAHSFKYRQQWLNLWQPETREEWRERKFKVEDDD